jgi:hypothetical protein
LSSLSPPVAAVLRIRRRPNPVVSRCQPVVVAAVLKSVSARRRRSQNPSPPAAAVLKIRRRPSLLFSKSVAARSRRSPRKNTIIPLRK